MTEIKSKKAYAVIDGNGINVRTISPARRSAIVNWLVVHKHCPIYQTTTDEQIEEMWKLWSDEAYVARVKISRYIP